MNITICMVTGGSVKTDTVSSLCGAISAYKQPVQLVLLTGGYSYQNRNIGVQMAQDAKSSHILFIDADMIFSSDYIKRLMEHDKDIIGANYNEKKLPLTSTIKKDDEKGNMVFIDLEHLPKEPFEVDAIGSGFLLIKMDVFKKLKHPYFQAPSGETIHDFTTEDYFFCRNAKQAGYTIYCDPSLHIGHCGDFIF